MLIPIVSLTAVSFVAYLQTNLIPSNMHIVPYTYQINWTDFKTGVSEVVKDICVQRLQPNCDLVQEDVLTSSLKELKGKEALKTFATWLTIDEDWFSVEKASKVSEKFLRREKFYFAKGVPSLVEELSNEGLAITVENNELTVWTAQLND